MRRKEFLKAAFGSDSALPQPLNSQERVPSGAVRAMGLSLGRISEDAARVELLEQELASGERVQELDSRTVDPSFVDDRLDRTGDPEFRKLVDSIAASGQQVPILVRPHPDKPGSYQVAYGHRRLSACAELGRPVKALVRSLTDDELVVAQGKENAERRNLTFIERAMFAAHLERSGFARSTIQAALAAHPADMTRLLAVARTVPRKIVAAIGPAPRAGRPRWLELAALLGQSSSDAVIDQILKHASFQRASSDARFDTLIERLRASAGNDDPMRLIRNQSGNR